MKKKESEFDADEELEIEEDYEEFDLEEEIEEPDEEDEVLDAWPPEPGIPSSDFGKYGFPPDLDLIIDEIVAKKWGKGQDRRLRLEQAGFDHVEVQKALIRRINHQ